MTTLMVLLSLAYFLAAFAGALGAHVPFQVFLWFGLILILGWPVVVAVRNKKGVGQGAYRTGQLEAE